MENANNKKPIISILWSFFDLMSRQGISLIVQIILARLLMPEHFGLIGMIYIFIVFSQALVNSGLDQALIREEKVNNQALSTVFFFNLTLSLILYICIYSLAPTIAHFYGQTELTGIIRIIMIGIIFNAMTVVQRVIIIREINFKAQSIITIIASIMSGIIAILLALNDFGVWSLVFQQLLIQFIIMISLMVYNKWYPTLVFDFRLFSNYFRFSYKLLIAALFDSIEQNSYHIIIGKIFPAPHLGYFTNAKKISDISSHSFSNGIQRVVYPLLSKLKDNKKELTENYVKIIRITAYIYFPITFILIAIAPFFIPLLLGEQWEPSVVLFQLLLLGSMLYPVNSLNMNVLKVVGRSDVFLRLTIIRLMILISMLITAFIVHINMITITYIFILQSCITLVLNTLQTRKFINYGMVVQICHLIRIIIPSVLMFIIIKSITKLLFLDSFLMMSIQIISGIFIYLLISLVTNRWELTSVLNILIKLLNKK